MIYAVIKYGAIFRTESVPQFRTITPHLPQIHNECAFHNAFPMHTLLAAFKIETAFFQIKHQGFILFYYLSSFTSFPLGGKNRRRGQTGGSGACRRCSLGAHTAPKTCAVSPFLITAGKREGPCAGRAPPCLQQAPQPQARRFCRARPTGCCHFIAVLQQPCSCVTDMNCSLPLMRNREGKPTNILGFQSLSATWKLKKVLALVP